MATAAVVTNSLVGTFDPNVVDGGPATIISSAIGRDPDAERRLADTFTFKVEAETSSNNDPVTVVNLNTQGLTWIGDNGFRNITTRAWWRNVAGTAFGYVERVQTVKGSAAGTTPALNVNGEIPAFSLSSAVQLLDRSYRTRNGITTTLQSTPTWVNAGVAISSSAVVVRCLGQVAGADLRWLVEVDVGALKIVPIGVT